MAGFVELDPLLAWKAIEGYPNELDTERKSLDAFYRQFACQRCGGPMRKEISPKHVFSDPNTLAPRSVLRCTQCACLLDPHSGLLLELGDADKVHGLPIVGK